MLSLFLDGMTYFSALDLKFGIEHVPLSDHKLAQFRDNLSELDLIILDEVSLIGADMLYRIHMRLREIFQCDDLFANKSILLVGDLLQLPPVKATYIFNRPYNKKFWGLYQDNNLWKSFTPIVLKTIFRQGDASTWANSLNRLRQGIVTDEDEALLRTRITEKDFLEKDAMHVFYMNKDVKNHNDKMINKLDSKLVTIPAIKNIPKGYPVTITEHGTIGTSQFMDKLSLKKGARVKLTFNVNTTDKLVNGSFGEVAGFEYDSSGNLQFIIVSFDDPSAGKLQREHYSRISSKYKDVNGTPIERHELQCQPTATIRYKILQFPLRLSYASTAHSMQGMTVKTGSKLVVHFSKKFQDGMAYVMLSRCEKLQDMYISGDFSPNKIKCNPAALEESKRILQTFDASVESTLETKNCLKITYLNVMSVLAHYDDIKESSKLMSSTILGLGETWMDKETTLDLPDFHPGTFENIGPGKGLAAFSKEPVTTSQKSFGKFSGIRVDYNGIHIIFLYLSHEEINSPYWTKVLEVLKTWIPSNTPTIIMGDMNWHFHQASTHPMRVFLERKGFQQLVERATHDKGNCLDHIYINAAVSSLGPVVETQSTYFSDHDIITLLFPAINLVT